MKIDKTGKQSGLFIPDFVLVMKLLLTEKAILSRVIYFNNADGLYASNNTLGKLLGVCPATIKNSVRKLKNAGLVFDSESSQTKRRLWLTTKGIAIVNKATGVNITQVVSEKLSECEVEVTRALGENLPPKKNSKKNEEYDSHYYKNAVGLQLAQDFFDSLRKINPDLSLPNMVSWQDEFNRMLSEDGRNAGRINAVLKWLERDGWWRGKILSPSQLRKKFEKLETRMLVDGGIDKSCNFCQAEYEKGRHKFMIDSRTQRKIYFCPACREKAYEGQRSQQAIKLVI